MEVKCCAKLKWLNELPMEILESVLIQNSSKQQHAHQTKPPLPLRKQLLQYLFIGGIIHGLLKRVCGTESFHGCCFFSRHVGGKNADGDVSKLGMFLQFYYK